MTRVYVDKREVPLPPSAFESLDRIVKHVEDHLLPPDIVIRQIEVDGAPLFSEHTPGSGPAPQTDHPGREKIEIITGTLAEIARDSIREAQAYLDRVEALTPSLVTSFQLSPGPEAFEQLKQLFDGFYWLHLLLDRIGAAFKVTADIHVSDGTTARDCHFRFASILKQLVEAQERQDFVLIADLLEYEILPLVPEWKALFAVLQQITTKEK
jgi:hypothetical protein